MGPIRLPCVQNGIYGATLHGGKARLVRVEALLGRGLSRVLMVGMPDAVALEARERLPPALRRHGFPFPGGKLLFNLVPAELPKTGLPLDLALAVALLVAEEQVAPPRPYLYLAELDLEGRLGPPARGTLLAAMAARGELAGVITAPAAAAEAALAPDVPVYGLEDLAQLAAFLRAPERFPAQPAPPAAAQGSVAPSLRLDDVRAQQLARRAAVLAAAGRLHLLLEGPPGTGKSLLARRIGALLPPLAPVQALELAQVEAACGRVQALPRLSPVRAPHSSISAQGMLGGGHPLRPGEISRAHGGVLFLDEMLEFARPVLEGLRQPLEEREVRLQRVQEVAVFPADFLLVAAMNPCPCGYSTHPSVPCTCPPALRQRYRSRLSGPLQDRFDLHVDMQPVEPGSLHGPRSSPTDEEARRLLAAAAEVQHARAEQGLPGPASRMELQHLNASGLPAHAERVLADATDFHGLSGRGYLRCLRVARTIADIQGCAQVRARHLLEALNYRFPASRREGATTG